MTLPLSREQIAAIQARAEKATPDQFGHLAIPFADVPALCQQALRAIELEAERDALAKLVYVPGLWRCAKCEFTLVQRTLYAQSGTVGPRDEPGDKCPNCNSPLWRVTERDDRHEMLKRSEEMFFERDRLQSELTAARKALEEERERCAKLDGLLNTPELADFTKAVQIEAAHQRERWGDEHDRTKHAHDWVAVLTHLIGKATKAFWDGDVPKLKHHIITTAAVCNNWHARILEAESALPAPEVKP